MIFRKRHPHNRGFTLLELLVALGGAVMLVLAAGALLMGGLRVGERIYARNAQGDVAIVGAILEKDVRNTFMFYAISFDGAETKIQFPGFVATDKGKTELKNIGTIAYVYDSQRKALFRKTWPFPWKAKEEDSGELLLSNISRFSFSFLGQESLETMSTHWQSSWQDQHTFPCAVRMDVQVGNDPAGSIRQTVIFPSLY